VASGGGIHRLMRQIPQKRAMAMILTGRRGSAHEGQTLGFVNAVVASGSALETAMGWAEEICEASPMAVRASKQMAYEGLDEDSLGTAICKIYPEQQRNLDSEDYREGPLAFAQKRK